MSESREQVDALTDDEWLYDLGRNFGMGTGDPDYDWIGYAKAIREHVRAALEGQQSPERKTTGWAARRDHYNIPVLFNPYTGEPRDVRDVQSDPQGILIRPPGSDLIPAGQSQSERALDASVTRGAEVRILRAEGERLREALRSLDARLRECFSDPITAEEAYDSFYQEMVADALASPQSSIGAGEQKEKTRE